MKRSTKCCFFVLALGLLLGWPGLLLPVFSAEKMVRIGYSTTVFSNVDLGDARAALRVWVDHLFKEENVHYQHDTAIYADFAELKKAFAAGAIDVIAASPFEFLELQAEMKVEGHESPVIRGQPTEGFFIIVNAKSGLNSLADLRGRSLVVDNRLIGDVPLFWLDSFLMKSGLGDLEQFIGRIKIVKKPSEVVLPVFFGQVDVGLVREEGFATMLELNPQLGRDLRVLASSPTFLRSVVSFREGFDPEVRQVLERSIQSLHKNKRGQQILTLFKVDQFIPFHPEYLRTTEALWKEHRALHPKMGRVPK